MKWGTLAMCLTKLTFGCIAIISFLNPLSAKSEYRIWGNHQGKNVEAEYVKIIGDYAYLRKVDGQIEKVSKSNLCKADQEYLQLHNPPKFTVDTEVEVKLTGRDSYAPGSQKPLGKGFKAVEKKTYKAVLSVDVLSSDKEHYKHGLFMDIYWIAWKELSLEERREFGDNGYVILKSLVRVPVKLSSSARKQEWSWESPPESFYLQNKVSLGLKSEMDGKPPSSSTYRFHDGINCRIFNVYGRNLIESETYFGYVAVLRDERNIALAYDSDIDSIQDSIESIFKTETGKRIEGLKKHRKGHYR